MIAPVMRAPWGIVVLFRASALAYFALTGMALAGEAEFSGDQYGRVNLYNPQSTASYESILDSRANFEALNLYDADDRLRRLSRPVGRLDVKLANGGMATCTAMIISENHILTNNHCIPGATSAVSASIIMNYYSSADEGSAARFEVNVKPLETSIELDYSILAVRGNPARTFGTVRFDPRDPKAGESLLIIHHPGGRPKYVTRGGCLAFAPNAVDGNNILHRCDTIPGSSGAPVLSDADGRVVALHYAGFADPQVRNNRAKRISRIVESSPILRSLVRGATTATNAIHLGDGMMYTGGLKGGVPEGTGEMVTAEGTRFVGSFTAGNLEGNAKIVYADGTVNDVAKFSRGSIIGVYYCNSTSRLIYLSVGYRSEEKWMSSGWWHLQPKSCIKLFENTSGRFYYWRAEAGNLKWEADRHAFCIDESKRFEIADAQPCPQNAVRRGFLEIDLDGKAGFVQFITD